jgi:hypothetical protein
MKIPSLGEVNPAYAAAGKRLGELQQQLTAAEARVQQFLSTACSGGRGDTGKDPLTAEAERLIAGEAPSRAQTVEHEAALKSLAQARHEREVLTRAVELQRRVVSEEAGKASREVCAQVKPEHRALVKKMAAALATLGEAVIAERAFRDSLNAAGVSHSELRALGFYRAGDPLDPHGFFCQWFREAFVAGLVTEADVPAEWRAAWKQRSGFELKLLLREETPRPVPAVSAARADGWLRA